MARPSCPSSGGLSRAGAPGAPPPSQPLRQARGGPRKHAKVFSPRDGRLLHDLKKHTDWVTSIQYSSDSVLLATGDRNGGLVVWEADSGQELYPLTGHQAAITAVSWRDDSEVLL